ncbi:MAG: DUF6226 family protein, partial [Brachybacterium tyrofermentans]
MTFPSAPTWWEEHEAIVSRAAEDGLSVENPPFSADLLALLTDVEAAFAQTGADTPGWEDPHHDPTALGERRDSRDEEYSRCSDPGKYRILWTRAEAWTQVLTARGWADSVEIEDGAQVSWAVDPRVDRYRTTVLRPRRPGAQPLVLVRTAPDDATGSTDLAAADAVVPDLVVGFGEPAVAVLEPDCLCDACDSGSRDLLEVLDQAILSIVDGSSEVVRSPDGASARTSFGAESGSDVDGSAASLRVTASPWADDWASRPLCPPIEPLSPMESAWQDEMLRDPWPTRLLDAALAVLPAPLEGRIHRLRTGRTAPPTRYAT